MSKTKEVDVNQEVANYIVETLRDPELKKEPAMVAAIAELYATLIRYY
ncbi:MULTISPECIES: hypothetical protein [Lacticaseibacillus]|nr:MULTISPECIES: hypothetical protein [Lacticaseibacillus]